MSWKIKKRAALLAGLLLLAGAIYVLFNYFSLARDYIYGPPMLFIRNRYLSLDIYPHGFQSASVFTNCDIEATTPPEDIAILRLFLRKHGIPGVFFVIPDYIDTYPVKDAPQILAELRSLVEEGHEVAQEGTYHTYGPDLARGAPEGAELFELPYDEQRERIEQGHNALAELGFFPVGFRAPEFVTTPDTFRVLEICDFLYSSSTLSPPRTFSSLLRRPLTEGVLYPYHPSGYRLLEFTDQVNPLQKFDKGVRIFRRIHSLNGVFVYHTYIGSVSKPENLQILEEFFEIILAENTWCTTLSTLSRWWLAREKLRVESAREGDCLVVTFTNPTPYPLDDIGLWISRSPSGARRYRVQDHNGVALAEGALPVREKIFFSVPGETGF